eukprot:2517859-Prymnesium_polylepis.1
MQEGRCPQQRGIGQLLMKYVAARNQQRGVGDDGAHWPYEHQDPRERHDAVMLLGVVASHGEVICQERVLALFVIR